MVLPPRQDEMLLGAKPMHRNEEDPPLIVQHAICIFTQSRSHNDRGNYDKVSCGHPTNSSELNSPSTFCLMLLCGRTDAPLQYTYSSSLVDPPTWSGWPILTSSPIDTLSPMTDVFSSRAHFPTVLFQPTIELLIHAWSLTLLF